MNHPQAIYEFGEFALDVGQQRLLRLDGGEAVALTGKPFDTLVYLVEHAGEPLDKETLLRAVWPDVVVEENSLTQTISSLRQMLGETPGENRYIATLPRKGYRFVAPVCHRTSAPQPVVRRPRRVAVWAGAGIVAVIAVAVAIPWMRGSHETRDPEAIALFASGRFAYLRLTESSLLQAIGFFEQAVARDPEYARAYAGIADAKVLLAVLGLRAPDAVYPSARIAAETALKLDPELAAAHVSLGQILMVHEHDLPGAARELARALELDPNYAPAYFYRGALAGYKGDASGALAAFDRAMQLDPYALSIRAARAFALFHARRYDAAIASLRQTLALDDRFDLARSFLMRALLAKGEYEEVLADMRGRTLHAPGSYGFVAQALALSGRRADARAELDRVLSLSKRRHVPAYDIAMIYAALDDADNTFSWLERSIDDGSPMGTFSLDPMFDQFRTDPRFARLVVQSRSPKRSAHLQPDTVRR